MNGGWGVSGGQRQARYARKRIFIPVMLVTLFITCMLAGFLLRDQNSPTDDGVEFTVRSYGGSQTISITAEVNLTDGMDREEAIVVAARVFDKVLDFGPRYERSIYIREALEDNSGMWVVNLSWAVGSTTSRAPGLSGLFMSTIYPQNKTVLYFAHVP